MPFAWVTVPGVQFHPEFSADIMRAYVSEQTATLLKEGHNVEALKAAIGNTDAANTLLKRFMMIVKEQACAEIPMGY